MSCFDNLIGIKGLCSPVAPDSGYYIEDRGLDLDLVNHATGQFHESGIQLIQDKIQDALRDTTAKIRSHLEARQSLKSIVQNGIVGRFRQNKETQAAEVGYLKGVQVKIDEYPYLEFFISQITLHAQNSGAENVLIYDLISGTLLDTISVTAVAGVPTQKDVYKSYPTNGQRLNLFIGTDADVYKSDLYSGGCSSCGGGWYNDGAARFSGRKILSAGTFTDENLLSQDGSSGVSVRYNVNCSYEPFLCSIKNLIARPALFLARAYLLDEAVYTKRLNSIVNIYKADHKELSAYYIAQYEEIMNGIMQNIALPNDRCFKCSPKVRVQTALA